MMTAEYETRGRWAREQIERHLGREVPDEDHDGRLLRAQLLSDNPECWRVEYTTTVDEMREVRQYSTGDPAPIYFFPATNQVYVAMPHRSDGAGGFEKWVDGEKVDERHHRSGETIDVPW